MPARLVQQREHIVPALGRLVVGKFPHVQRDAELLRLRIRELVVPALAVPVVIDGVPRVVVEGIHAVLPAVVLRRRQVAAAPARFEDDDVLVARGADGVVGAVEKFPVPLGRLARLFARFVEDVVSRDGGVVLEVQRDLFPEADGQAHEPLVRIEGHVADVVDDLAAVILPVLRTVRPVQIEDGIEAVLRRLVDERLDRGEVVLLPGGVEVGDGGKVDVHIGEGQADDVHAHVRAAREIGVRPPVRAVRRPQLLRLLLAEAFEEGLRERAVVVVRLRAVAEPGHPMLGDEQAARVDAAQGHLVPGVVIHLAGLGKESAHLRVSGRIVLGRARRKQERAAAHRRT